MNTSREFLEEQRDNRLQDAKFEKNQFLASFIMSASGAVAFGVGLDRIASDTSGSLVAMAFGSMVAVAGAKLGLSELQDYTDLIAQGEVIQNEINQLSTSDDDSSGA